MADRPATPREHIDQAKHLLACGVYHTAQAHAMIAIAELLADMTDRDRETRAMGIGDE